MHIPSSSHVQKKLLIPIIIVLSIMSLIFISIIYKLDEKSVNAYTKQLADTTIKTFYYNLEKESQLIEKYQKDILDNNEFRKMLKNKDKDALQKLFAEKYKYLNATHNITHFYIHLPTRINLIRLHKPSKSGDLINRYTLVSCAKTQWLSSGIEIGHLGNFTLRVVQPIFDDKMKLIGYLELGKEIGLILENLQISLEVELALLMNKDSINQEEWLMYSNKKLFWDDMDTKVLTYSSYAKIRSILKGDRILEIQGYQTFTIDQHSVQVMNRPLYDASSTNVASLLVINDYTQETNSLHSLLYYTALGLGILILILTFFLNILLKKTDQQIMQQHNLLIDANKKAEQAVRAKSNFLAAMSHEIRTPLNAMMGFINILFEHEKSLAKIEQFKIVKSSSDLLLNIVNDILDYSKMEKEQMSLEYKVFNLKDFFSHITEIYKYNALKKSLVFEAIISENIPKFIILDALRLQQVFYNILNNALKFTDKNGKVLLVIDYSEKDSTLFCMIKDNGIGIKIENQEKIFLAFEQADNSTTRMYGGTGLGLAISNKILKLMDSSLGVKSTFGEGSSFFFSLKVKASDAKGVVTKIENIHNIESFLEKNVLIVEDNKDNQRLLTYILEEKGVHYEVVADGVEAIEIFKSHTFDMIFMDENMPNMSGIESINNIRAIEKTKQLKPTPIVMVTANALAEDKERFLDLDINGYISKPYVKEDILEILCKKFYDI